MTETRAPAELSHAEQEAAAYSAFLSAVQRGDKDEAAKLWGEVDRLIKGRSQAVVDAMEKRMGLG